MEGHELLGKANRVKAPSDFEARVFSKLGEAKRARARRRAVFRYAFAGSAAVFLIGFVLLSVFDGGRRTPVTYAGKSKADAPAGLVSLSAPSRARAQGSSLPVMETLNYSSEFRNASYQPRTVYILEQVSEVRPSEIKY